MSRFASAFAASVAAALGGLCCSLGLPREASAQVMLENREQYRTPQRFAVGVGFGPYSPDIDKEFAEGTGPHARYFGTNRRLLTKVEFEYQFMRRFGSLAVGASAGFFREKARAFTETAGETRAGDDTSLSLYPTALQVIYRFDEIARRWKFPLIPYAKAGLNYTLWRTFRGNGDISEAPTTAGAPLEPGRGASTGWQVAGGLSFLLDVIDPSAARALDGDIGVNHTHVFLEYGHVESAGFSGRKVLEVGDRTWAAGLLFEF